jgi:hypothetical protein
MAASSALSTPHVDAHPIESFLATILSVPSLLITAIDASRFPTDAQLPIIRPPHYRWSRGSNDKQTGLQKS